MQIKEALSKGILKLRENKIEDASLKTKLLLADILKCKKETLIIRDTEKLTEKDEKEFFTGIEKIKNGYPLEYITKKKEFMKMEFEVEEGILIPRADTEILVEEALKLIDKKSKILELCTGSGVIGISLAKYCKDHKIESEDVLQDKKEKMQIICTDVNEKALKLAKRNLEKLIKNKNIKFIKSDMFENIQGKFDIIISNPPYIKTSVIQEFNLKYEPNLALDGGEDGLKFYKIIIEEGHKYLNKNRNYSTRNRV